MKGDVKNITISRLRSAPYKQEHHGETSIQMEKKSKYGLD